MKASSESKFSPSFFSCFSVSTIFDDENFEKRFQEELEKKEYEELEQLVNKLIHKALDTKKK